MSTNVLQRSDKTCQIKGNAG